MRFATCLIRDLPHYRRQAFADGLRANGYVVSFAIPPSVIRPSDCLVIWNRYGGNATFADRFEAVGAPVFVAENGYLTPEGVQMYAVARSQHNGAGSWRIEEGDRWSPLGIELKPWRENGAHILVLPQRGIGPPGVAMPRIWVNDVMHRLKRVTGRPVRLRAHPGKHRPPLEPDFANCWAAVTWGSSAALKAIVAGIPVFYEFPQWIGAGAGQFEVRDLERPFLGDRLPMLRRLAWSQWSVGEISAGEPFRCL